MRKNTPRAQYAASAIFLSLMWFIDWPEPPSWPRVRRRVRVAAAAGLLASLAPLAVAQSSESGTDAPASRTTTKPAPDAQEPSSEPDDATAAPTFDVVVESKDEDLREMVAHHNDLQRFRVVRDLEPVELERLMVLAERNVRDLLGTRGYFNPDIRLTREAPPGARPRVRIAFEPGPLTTVQSVDIGFLGDIATRQEPGVERQRERIRSGWRLREGRAFTQDGWSDAKTQALRTLVARRYPAGRIEYSVADIDAPANHAKLGLRFDSGPLFRLGPLQVTGNENGRYDPVLVERVARLRTGEPYDQVRLNDAQARLAGSGYYDAATVYVDPDSKTPEAAPVQIQVTEARMQKIITGLGYSTDGGPRLALEHWYNRLPGLGWRAITKAQVEQRNSFIQTDLQGIPDANLWRWGAFARAERLDDGELLTMSQQLRFGRSYSDDRYDRNIYVRYDRSSVKRVDGTAVTDAMAGDGSAVSANYIWTGRYFNNKLYPTRGYGLGAEVGGGVTIEGVRKPFLRGVARATGFVPLSDKPGSTRLALRAETGAVVVNSAARVPSALLFRTGGDSTVRGYRYRSIGIDRPNGVVVPGKYMVAGSVEWQRPILRDGEPTLFEHTVFVDAGDVADRAQDLRPKVGVGTGLRVRTPVGPLQLDLAYGLQAKRFRVHLSVGFVF